MPSKITLPHRLCSHLSNVAKGSIARTAVPYTTSNLAISTILLRHGLISNVTLGDARQADPAAFQNLTVDQRRLWLEMKYRNGLPVLRQLDLISKPSFHIVVTRDELGRILRGKRARNIGGVGMGEILIVKTPDDKGKARTGRDAYMDGWEAWRAGLGGELILRAA